MSKLFKYYDTYEHFKSDKISDTINNNSYYDFDNNTSVEGSPNVVYDTVCFVEDKNIIYTHGHQYTSDSISTNISDVTVTEHGLMTASDKIKLDSLEYTGEYSLKSVNSASSGTVYLWKDFSTNKKNFVKKQNINFVNGDKFVVNIDLSASTQSNELIFTIGSDIASDGSDLPEGKGNFYFYHVKTDSSETIQCKYVDSTTTVQLTNIDCSSTAKQYKNQCNISFGYEVSIEGWVIPQFHLNGYWYASINLSQSVLLKWMINTTIFEIGSLYETSEDKLPDVKYNYCQYTSGTAQSNVSGIEVSHIYGDTTRSFIIPNATTSSNGLLSYTDKATIDELKSTIATLETRIAALESN